MTDTDAAVEAAAALGAPATVPPYVPTMADMMSIDGAMHRYSTGLDTGNTTLLASAFAEDGVLVLIDNGVEFVRLTGRAAINAGMGGANPPSGHWHFRANSHFTFESSARATHYAYWVTIIAPVLAPGESSLNRRSEIGMPGHYDDVLVKVGRQWLLHERVIVIGNK